MPEADSFSPRLPGMPILPRQRDIFPESLLDEPPAAEGLGWVAFYTLSRREKDLMRKLEAAAIPFYSPLVVRRLRSPGGRTRISHVPLFPGYVFSLVDDEQRRASLATNTVARWWPICVISSVSSIPNSRSLPRRDSKRASPCGCGAVRCGALRARWSSDVANSGSSWPSASSIRVRRSNSRILISNGCNPPWCPARHG